MKAVDNRKEYDDISGIKVATVALKVAGDVLGIQMQLVMVG